MARPVFILVLVLLSFGSAWSLPKRSCKCLYGDDCFPREIVWARFNQSIGGKLLRPLPTAFACHDPYYDERACNETITLWSDSLWKSQFPGALELPQYETYGKESCFVNTSRDTPCQQGSVPVYAVNVSSAVDVQVAIAFAKYHNLRLVIKNTGHDYFGKSTARGALSLWMHSLKNIDFFQYHSCLGESVSAVKVGAGVQWHEVYSAATAHNVVVVGALSTSVGAAGGWWQGAGHSNLSPSFGLGADNVLEIELVTASGEHITANSCCNEDIFWAMRGGGGGTFGVVISVTYATHPAPSKILGGLFGFNAKDTPSFQDFLSEFAAVHPNLTDMGWSGTFVLRPNSLLLNYFAIDKDPSFVNSSMESLFNYVSSHPSLSMFLSDVTQYGTYDDWFKATICAVYGNNMDNGMCVDRIGQNRQLGSRLIPRHNLESNPKQIGEMLVNALNTPDILPNILGLSVAGGVVSHPKVDNAVNPAWRKAIWHVVVRSDSGDGEIEEREAELEALNKATKVMEDVTPGSGAYVNEASYKQVDWQFSFYGSHYSKLKAIKDRRDPTGLFVCHHCVGSEDWNEDFKCPKTY